MEFKHEQLPELYEGVRVGNATMGVCYIFSDIKGDFMEVYILDGFREWRFVIDNFPMQRKIFNSNLPYRSIEDFENDLSRIGIEKLKRKSIK